MAQNIKTQRKSWLHMQICDIYGDVPSAVVRFRGCTFKEVQAELSQALGAEPSLYAVRTLCAKYGVVLKKDRSHHRATQKGRYQSLVQVMFGLPFDDVVDALLLPHLGPLKGQGDYKHMVISCRGDIFDAVAQIAEAGRPCFDARTPAYPSVGYYDKTIRKHLRYTLLRAIGERAALLGHDICLDPRFPSSRRPTAYNNETQWFYRLGSKRKEGVDA